MNCREMEPLLYDAVDGPLSAEMETLVEEHAGSCGECDALLNGLGRLENTIRNLPPPRSAPARRLSTRPLLALAAAMLAVVGVARLLSTGDPAPANAPVAQTDIVTSLVEAHVKLAQAQTTDAKVETIQSVLAGLVGECRHSCAKGDFRRLVEYAESAESLAREGLAPQIDAASRGKLEALLAWLDRTCRELQQDRRNEYIARVSSSCDDLRRITRRALEEKR